ncbi:hypothetical protein [Fusobacterium hwasookii]|uniref:Molecular chaperone DnaK n=1 Tax=Fusobacterium hwasookii ChDC F128 TaxID=1216362 RepID=A0ABN0GYA3_9FUSO|nr:hypothetical protein [Fusobacterium hwasookii]EJU06842.1 hypothetical protein B437_10365 [Fusobacterium hwasookii ChDC F128]
MGKKNLEKKAKRGFGILEQNQVEVIEIKENKENKENKELSMQDVNLNELNKFEKIKKFRDFENVIITYGDNEKDKFKDFQEMYDLINNKIEVQDKKWIYSEKDGIAYILSYQLITTEVIDGVAYKDDNYKDAEKELEKISNRLKDRKLNFNLPTRNELELLDKTNLMENDTKWVYKDDFLYLYVSYNNDDNEILYYGEYKYNLIGIDNLDNFFEFLENRNKKSNFKNNNLKNFDRVLKEIDFNEEYDFEEMLKIIDTVNDDKLKKAFEEVEDEFQNGTIKLKDFFEKYKYSLLQNDNLKNLEVILNYELLDPSIITKEYKKKFNNLVEAYRTYKGYISCIYNEDDEKVGIFFNTKKIIESIKNIEKIFSNIEINYLENKLEIEKEIVYSDKNVYYYKNGDIEEVYNTSSEKNKSIYYYKNGDKEERIYQNGILNGESIFKFSNGDTEERNYRNGILEGKAIYKTENRERAYFYTDGTREEMPKLKYYLSIDKERINIDDYQETILTDPNIGHWDLKEEDKKELKEILGKNVYKKDPKKDINQGGIVAIDFGTKSTVVVYQKDRENILPMRISGEKLNREVRNTDYENPTVIEFRDIDKFLKDYKAKIGRPDTKWEDITVSHNAFRNLVEGTNELSIISDIKQWCASKNENIVIVDRKGKEILLPPYLELNEKSKDYLDPVEIYAYYIGSYINNMINSIYLEYYLSFPVTYEKAIREKILKSFEKGIQKSLPIEIQEDKDLMKKFRVRHGANEPAAFAVCALSKLEIVPKNEEDKVYYGVFDFGGGTTDFDFGIWKYSEDEDLYDYELEHFGAGGERYLGGENILKELAYKVFSDNSSNLRKSQIQYTRPEWCAETVGEEILVSKTREARINTRRLMEYIRTIWEDEGKDRERIDIINCPLFDTNGNFNAMELYINEDELKSIIREKIEKGIKNFFIKMEDAFKGEDVKEINVFLAGNSSQYPYVEEMFKSYEEKMKDKIKLIVYDSNAFKNIKDKDKKIIPTVKTGVAFGLIYSRNSGRIKVISRDEKANVNNEVNFKFYVGNNRRNKFNCIISPNSSYDEYKFFGIVKSDIFELYYSTSPEAQTNEMKLAEAKIKRVNLKKEYDEEDRYRIYLRADESDKLAYAIVKEEKDIETKNFIEEGEISLN